MLEAELIRDVVPAGGKCRRQHYRTRVWRNVGIGLLVGAMNVLMVRLFEGALYMHVNVVDGTEAFNERVGVSAAIRDGRAD